MTGGAVPAIALLLLLGVLALLARQLLTLGLGLGSDFVIRYRGTGSPVVRGRVPRSKVFEIKEFCVRDLAAAAPFTVRGTWGPNRSLRVRCTGRLSAGDRQRVRNFLVQCLR